jgi:response regulator of citrate/malate metabolism
MKKILLLDDDPIFNSLHSRILQLMGIAEVIHIAKNGQEGMDYLLSCISGDSILPDVILLDLSMPEMNGFVFLEAIKKSGIPDKVEIIVITSSVDLKDMERAKKLGVLKYLIKPVPLESLKMALR